LLQFSGNIITSLITAFLAFVLKHIRANFCKNWLDKSCEDSRQYVADLLKRKDRQAKKVGP